MKCRPLYGHDHGTIRAVHGIPLYDTEGAHHGIRTSTR
ncbi:predicted protein [Streptomyces filamentosus NRRL 15998]|uniref:Predicted protein n=1 Tax=Streptomyces filamentosus NRRL 15998 TaxID=457431 RepID=D6ATW7_STRFL|nr:predicted protein [Streptomyces filamentosus NRRL 15998]